MPIVKRGSQLESLERQVHHRIILCTLKKLLLKDAKMSRFINKEHIPADYAYVGLALPGEAGSWQRESKGYQFWTKTDKSGYFTISNVRAGEYNFYAYVPGFVGDFKLDASEKLLQVLPFIWVIILCMNLQEMVLHYGRLGFLITLLLNSLFQTPSQIMPTIYISIILKSIGSMVYGRDM